MNAKNRNQVENIITLLLLAIVVCSGVFLAIVLYQSPSL